MPVYLSKSDYKLARTCPTKLFYKKKHFPSRLDDDEYLRLLGEGGFMVEEIARLLYPGGKEVDHSGGNQASIDATQGLLCAGHTELFEPTFVSNGKLIRVDIFRVVNDTIELIEVKAKSWDSSIERPTFRKKGSGLNRDWDSYIADVAYQKMVLEEVYPDHRVIPYLMMPDKAKTTSIDLLHRHFDVNRSVHPATGFTTYNVTFTGDVEALRKNHFLTRVNVEEEVAYIAVEVREQTDMLLKTLSPDVTRAEMPLSTDCKNCEFRIPDYDNSGFGMCWGDLGRHENHIFDLYYGTQLRGSGGRLFDEMIATARTSLTDLDEGRFRTAKGEIGARNRRQIIQRRHTLDQTEWQDDELQREMARCRYPLHFIDFETSTLAIPYHADMRPYESVAFQWSCHTMTETGGPTGHSEWINTDDAFPNFEFARSLRAQVGNNGTVLIWSSHERTILRHIADQMGRRYEIDSELSGWITDLLEGSRVVDMYKWCVAYYFHPLMKGRTSIKNVCDAVWQTDESVRDEFAEYVVRSPEGSLLSPYAGLPPVRVNDVDIRVSVGTDAVKAYQSMVYGVDKYSEEARAAIREGLLTYCKLDTASMVMIWRHWDAAARQY